MKSAKSSPVKIGLAAAGFAVAAILVAAPMGKEEKTAAPVKAQQQYSEKKTVGRLALFGGARCSEVMLGPVELSFEQRKTGTPEQAAGESKAAAEGMALTLSEEAREPMEKLCASENPEQKVCFDARISETKRDGKENTLSDIRKKGRLSEICGIFGIGIEREIRPQKDGAPKSL